MRRRAFTLGAVALASAPLAVLAQQPRPRRLAMVGSARPVQEMTESGPPYYRAFLQELRRLGLGEGDRLVIERLSGHDRPDPADLARAVVATQPDVIFSAGIQ